MMMMLIISMFSLFFHVHFSMAMSLTMCIGNKIEGEKNVIQLENHYNHENVHIIQFQRGAITTTATVA